MYVGRSLGFRTEPVFFLSFFYLLFITFTVAVDPAEEFVSGRDPFFLNQALESSHSPAVRVTRHLHQTADHTVHVSILRLWGETEQKPTHHLMICNNWNSGWGGFIALSWRFLSVSAQHTCGEQAFDRWVGQPHLRNSFLKLFTGCQDAQNIDVYWRAAAGHVEKNKRFRGL